MRFRPIFTLLALCSIVLSSGCCWCHRGCCYRGCGGCGCSSGCSSCGYTPGETLPPPMGLPPHAPIPPGAVAVPPLPHP